jgi:hypothetical protein
MKFKNFNAILLVLLVVIIFLKFFLPKQETHPPYSIPSHPVDKTRVCSILEGAAKVKCEELRPFCPNEDFEFFSCIARGLAIVDINASRAICLHSNLPLPRKRECFANALALVDIEAARNQCDLIEDNNTKIFCKANSIKFVDVEEAFKECDAFSSESQELLCKAMVASIRSSEEPKKYCNMINDTEARKNCLSIFEVK